MSKTYVKLKNVGDAATFTVTRCAPGTGRYPDVEFEDGDGNVYPVPKGAADRQLERLGIVEYPEVVGRMVKISRGENKTAPDKPFWNVDVVSGAKGAGGASNGAGPAVGNAPDRMRAPATTQSRPATMQDVQSIFDAEPVGEAKKPSGYALYKQITAQVLKDMPVLYKASGIELDAQAIAAITATVFIQASRNGHGQ